MHLITKKNTIFYFILCVIYYNDTTLPQFQKFRDDIVCVMYAFPFLDLLRINVFDHQP